MTSPRGLRRAAALALAWLAAAAPAGASGVAAVGKQAPAFRLADLHGAPVTLARFRGRPLYINLFASWCPPCRTELPAIVAAHARYGDRVTFLGVDAQETSGTARAFSRRMRIGYAVALDRGQMAVSYGAGSLPDSFFVDRTGVVRAVVHGQIDPAALERDLALIAS